MIQHEIARRCTRISRTTSMASSLRPNAIDLGAFGGGKITIRSTRRYGLAGKRARRNSGSLKC